MSTVWHRREIRRVRSGLSSVTTDISPNYRIYMGRPYLVACGTHKYTGCFKIRRHFLATVAQFSVFARNEVLTGAIRNIGNQIEPRFYLWMRYRRTVGRQRTFCIWFVFSRTISIISISSNYGALSSRMYHTQIHRVFENRRHFPGNHYIAAQFLSHFFANISIFCRIYVPTSATRNIRTLMLFHFSFGDEKSADSR